MTRTGASYQLLLPHPGDQVIRDFQIGHLGDEPGVPDFFEGLQDVEEDHVVIFLSVLGFDCFLRQEE